MTSIGTFAPGTGGILNASAPQPAAGADWSYTPPPHTRLRPICGRCTLTTSAVAGTRRVQLYVANSGVRLCQSANYGTQAASVTQNYTLTPGNDIVNALIGFDMFLAFPPGLILADSDTLAVETSGILGADQWSVIVFRFEEWIEA